MIKLSGSWVAMPTPFDNNGKIDFAAFELMIERQIAYGTSQLFVLGKSPCFPWKKKRKLFAG